MKALKKTKIKNSLRSFLQIFWKNLLVALLLFLVIDLIVGGLLFWHYFFRSHEIDKNNIETFLMVVDEKLFSQFMTEWENREKDFQEASKKSYPDPFSGNFVNESLRDFPEATSSDIIG